MRSRPNPSSSTPPSASVRSRLPAHASLLTGQLPPAHGVRDNHIYSLSSVTPTYTTWLKSRATTRRRSSAPSCSSGATASTPASTSTTTRCPDRRRSAAPATRSIARCEWLATRGDSPAPFFLWIHLFEPHAPYRTGSYAGEVTEVDREVARFVAALRERALWDSIGPQRHVRSRRVARRARRRDARLLRLRLDDPHSLDPEGAGPGAGPLRPPGAAARRDADDDRARQRRRRGHAPARRGRGRGPLARHLAKASIRASTRTARRCCRSISSTGASSKPFARRRSSTSTRRSRSCIGGATIPAKPGTWSRASAPPPPGCRRSSRACLRIRSSRRHTRRWMPSQAEKFMALGYIGQARSGTDRRPRRASRSEAEARDLSAGDVSADALGIGPSRRRARRARPRGEAGAGGDADPLPAWADPRWPGALSGSRRGARAHRSLESASRAGAIQARARVSPARRIRSRRNGAAGGGRRRTHNMRAYQNLAVLAYTRGDLARAESLARRAVAIDPTYFDAWNTLGAIYVLAKRPADAVQSLKTALALNPKSGQANYNLSLALALGRRREGGQGRPRRRLLVGSALLPVNVNAAVS